MSRDKGRIVPPGADGSAGKRYAWFALVLILALIPFAMGKYCEFGVLGAFDGGLNVYTAESLLQGNAINDDVFVSARPNTLLVNVIGVAIFGYNEIGPKVIQMVMQIAALLMVYYTLRKIYGDFGAGVSVILAALYLSCPPYSKFGNAKEQFMVACMLMAGCAFMLRYLENQRLWLFLTGAMAVGAFYFKPTGISLIGAIIIYLLVQTILKRISVSHVWADLKALVGGSVIGLIPLSLLYLWQGQLWFFWGTFPAFLVLLLASGYWSAIGFHALILRAVKGIKPLPSWILSFVLVAMFAVVVMALTNSFDVLGVCFKRMMAGSAYVASSREVTTFISQYNDVIKHYLSFIALIGIGLVAIGWACVRGISRWRELRQKAADGETGKAYYPAEIGDRFVLLLGVWWILDIAFVWISPRNYVEYYIPLMGSGSLLAGYVAYRCKMNPGAFIAVIVSWLVVDVLLHFVIPADGFPFVGFRSFDDPYLLAFLKDLSDNRVALVGMYFKLLSVKVVLFVLFAAFLIVLRKRKFQLASFVVFKKIGALVLAVTLITWYSWGGIVNLNEKVDDVKAIKDGSTTYPWVQVANFVKQHSLEDDTIFVWGWIPGIYVQAQRMSSARMAAYSDMHADDPDTVRRRMGRIVEDLKANPPKFIVDTKKMHFPYNTHPLFELWPMGKGSNGQAQFLDRDSLLVQSRDAFSQYYKWVDNYVFTHLTKGKGLSEERAQTLANMEAWRHWEMRELREFVLENYQPVLVTGWPRDPSRWPHVVFQLKEK